MRRLARVLRVFGEAVRVLFWECPASWYVKALGAPVILFICCLVAILNASDDEQTRRSL